MVLLKNAVRDAAAVGTIAEGSMYRYPDSEHRRVDLPAHTLAFNPAVFSISLAATTATGDSSGYTGMRYTWNG